MAQTLTMELVCWWQERTIQRVDSGIANQPRMDEKRARTPLEGRLRNIMYEFESAWHDTADKPKWRIDQEMSTSKWNVQTISDEDKKLKWMSKIAFIKFGLVGIDFTATKQIVHCLTLLLPSATTNKTGIVRIQGSFLRRMPSKYKVGARLHTRAKKDTWLLGLSTSS